jgi:hypothetical protein
LVENGQVGFSGLPSQAIMRYFGASATSTASIELDAYRQSQSSSVRLKSVQFLDERSEPKQRFTREEQLRVVVAFSVSKALRGFDVAMALVFGDGAAVFSETLSDHGPTLALEPGDYKVDFILSLRYLKVEPYFLTLYLLDDGRVLETADGIPLPEIYDPSADVFKESHRWGLMRVPLEWSVPKRQNNA